MNGKWKIPILLAAGIMIGIWPARAAHVGNVDGLVNLTNYQAALLVVTDSPPDASFLATTHKWVKEGQAFDDLYPKEKRLQIEVVQIDFTNGAVRVNENRVGTFYPPQSTNLAGAGKGIRLNHVDFDDALDLYAELDHRTLLIHPDLPQPLITLSETATNQTEAADILEKALQKQGASMIPDGDRFEWVVPAGATNALSPAAIPARLPAPDPSPANPTDALPAGSINFINVPLSQVLEVYQALTAKKWMQTEPLPPATITFHSQTQLTKAEALHAFDVLLAWHGLKIVDVDDKSFKVVPLADAG
jgi:hypothetical protein